MTESIFDELLTPTEASQEIRRSKSTLAKDRIVGTGPKHVRIGGRIYYKRSDLKAWVDGEIAKSSAENA